MIATGSLQSPLGTSGHPFTDTMSSPLHSASSSHVKQILDQTGHHVPSTECKNIPSTSFQPIFDPALDEYVKQIGIDPIKHPIAGRLQTCHSPDDVLKLIEEKTNEFKDYRDANGTLINSLIPVVNVIHALSGDFGEAASLVSRIALSFLVTFSPVCCYQVPFQPAGAIFAGVDILLTVRIL